MHICIPVFDSKMPLFTRNRGPRWASTFLLLPCCLAGFFDQKGDSAGVLASGLPSPTAATTPIETSERSPPDEYNKVSLLNEAAAYPAEMLQQPTWQTEGAQQPFESQPNQPLGSQSQHVFIESLPQQQHGSIHMLLSAGQSGDMPLTSEEARTNAAPEEETTGALLDPERVALFSQHRRQQPLEGGNSHLQISKRQEQPPASEQQQSPAMLPGLRPVKHHYSVRFPTVPFDTAATAGVQKTRGTKLGLGGDVQELPQPMEPTTSSVPTYTSPTEQTTWQAQPQMQGQQQSQQQQQENQTLPHAQEENANGEIPFFSALPESMWNYKLQGTDWTSTCAEGRRQSPVDLHIEGLQERHYRNLTSMYRRAFSGGENEFVTSALSSRRPWRRGDFFYFYPNSFQTLQVYRSSKVFQLRAAKNSMMVLGALFPTDSAEMLTAQHIFFHSPSEHTFQGEANRRQVEMQIWHFSDDPITFRASTRVNRSALPYLALFAEGSLGLPPQRAAEESSGTGDESLRRKKRKPGISIGTRLEDNLSSTYRGRRVQEAPAGEELQDLFPQEAPAGTEQGTIPEDRRTQQIGDVNQKVNTNTPEQAGLSALEMRATVRQRSTAAAAARAPDGSEATSNAEAAWNPEDQKEKSKERGELESPTAHWRVISLTFMSEELDQATVQDLKSLPSERLISALLQAELLHSTGKPGGETIKLKESLNLQALMMMLQLSNTEFFAYDGSSTMPPCQENVRWYVARQPLPVATETMLRFYKMLNPAPVSSPSDKDGNFRSLQNVEIHSMRNEGNVYLVQGFPLQLLVAASLGFDAMARLPRGEAPALQQFFNLSSAAPYSPSLYNTTLATVLLIVIGVSTTN